METRDCINLIIDFINSRYGKVYNSKYKKLHVYNYCLSLCNDSLDDKKIKMIVDSTFDYLEDHDYIVRFKHAFMTRKIIDDSFNLDINFESSNCKSKIKKINKHLLKF